MKLVKSNTILILLILALMGCTLEPSEIGGNEPAQSITIFTPVINQLPTRSVRALIPPEGGVKTFSWTQQGEGNVFIRTEEESR